MRSKSIRWEPPVYSEIGVSLIGFCYTSHGHQRANQRKIDEERIKLALEGPSRWFDHGKNRYEFQRQFGDERLRVVAKVTRMGWVNIVSVLYMNEWQIRNAFLVGKR